MDSDRYDIVIGGGSFVGLAIALGLAKSAPGTFRIAVVERMPVSEARAGRFDGRSVALTAAAQRMLEALGISRPSRPMRSRCSPSTLPTASWKSQYGRWC